MKAYKILILLLLFLSEAIQAQQTNDRQNSSKPNILWITIEDTSPQFIGCYGNIDARTPVIDNLAKDGVKFTNAFSTGTVCSPSRSCIITGVKTYKMGTGNHRSNYPIPEFIKGFPYYMKKVGYYTTNNVKTDYNVGNVKEFIKKAWNESSNKAGWWNRKPGQPFFSVFNFMDSHQSRTMTKSYSWYLKNVLNNLPEEERIGDNDFKMPPFYKDSPEMRKQFARVYNSLKLTDNEIGALLKKLDNDHLRDSTIIFFYADHGEGEPRGKTNGINFGYHVPFVIWFPEIYKDLSPWGTKGVITDELIDFEDLAPTLISLAGGTVPNYMKGRVLMGKDRSKTTNHLVLSADRSDDGIDMVRSVTNGRYLYSRNFMPFIPEARYIRYMEIGEIKQQMRKDLAEKKLNPLQNSLFEDRPAEFLFDIKNDIWETKNLSKNSKYKTVLKKMRIQLKKEVLQSRDIMFLPEYEISSISKISNPYEFRMNNKDYPINDIYHAASLSGFRGEKIAKQQIKLLFDSNKIVRYWAAVGLKSQNSFILKGYSNEIVKAMNDTYPPVAIITSILAFQEFNNVKAIENIKKYCADKNNNLSLLTIYFLIYNKNKDPFIDTVKRVLKSKNRNYNVKSACMDFLSSIESVENTGVEPVTF